jgi:hypothetical protein
MDKPEGTPDCCQGIDGPCDNDSPKWRRQNTRYQNELDNWINACDECFEYIEEEWAALWRQQL